MFIFCYVNRSDFKMASVGLFHLLAHIAIEMIYLILINQQELIIESIDHLEALVNESKLNSLTCLWCSSKFFQGSNEIQLQ